MLKTIEGDSVDTYAKKQIIFFQLWYYVYKNEY